MRRSHAASGAAPTEAVEIQEAVRRGGIPKPKLDPSPPFVYLWHPARWTVVAGRLIPFLRRQKLVSGVARIDKTRGGRWILNDFVAAEQAKGWTVIPQGLGPGGNYVRKMTVEPHPGVIGVAHVDPFAFGYPGSAKIGCDEEGYAEWCESLVESGVITPCPPYAAEALLDRMSETLAKYSQDEAEGKKPHVKQVQALRANIAVVEKYLESYTDDAEPVFAEDADAEDLTADIPEIPSLPDAPTPRRARK